MVFVASKPTGAEIQSGHDRQSWAEGLILQLPTTHDGRNSWLLNYGRGEEALRLRAKRGLPFSEEHQAAFDSGMTAAVKLMTPPTPIPPVLAKHNPSCGGL